MPLRNDKNGIKNNRLPLDLWVGANQITGANRQQNLSSVTRVIFCLRKSLNFWLLMYINLDRKSLGTFVTSIEMKKSSLLAYVEKLKDTFFLS